MSCDLRKGLLENRFGKCHREQFNTLELPYIEMMCFVMCLIYTWKDNRFSLAATMAEDILWKKEFNAHDFRMLSDPLCESITYLSTNKKRTIPCSFIRAFLLYLQRRNNFGFVDFLLAPFFSFSHSSSIQLPSPRFYFQDLLTVPHPHFLLPQFHHHHPVKKLPTDSHSLLCGISFASALYSQSGMPRDLLKK